MNIKWYNHDIGRKEREEVLGQKAILLWLTGLSGSGKSTIANELQKKLSEMRKTVYILDGDNIRHGLNSDLGFSAQDREENIRRIGEVAKLFVDAGVIVITAFISPYKKDRDKVRSLVGDDFIEVHVKCSLEECEKRDPKGLYKKARTGEIGDFTGIHAPYEEPENAELVLETDQMSVSGCSERIITYLKGKGLV